MCATAIRTCISARTVWGLCWYNFVMVIRIVVLVDAIFQCYCYWYHYCYCDECCHSFLSFLLLVSLTLLLLLFFSAFLSLWSKISQMAIVSLASNIPQTEIANYFGLDVLTHKIRGTTLRVQIGTPHGMTGLPLRAKPVSIMMIISSAYIHYRMLILWGS